MPTLRLIQDWPYQLCIINSFKLETIKTSINNVIDEQIRVYPYDGILFSNKEGTDIYNLDIYNLVYTTWMIYIT